MTRNQEQRDFPRVNVTGGIAGEVMVYQPMAIREISLGGLMVETHFPLQLNALRELKLELGGRTVVVKGRVVHCSISEVEQQAVIYRSGMEFVEPAPYVLAVLSDYIETLKNGRPTP